MLEFKDGRLTEREYRMEDEAQAAALFTTANGYMGVRGSFEEFGSIRIQGAYIRGLIDEIVEVMEPFSDNEYMKKWYLDEEKLKGFEYQESCVNFADILLTRVAIGGRTFYPWEGKVLFWERRLDPAAGVLTRTVVWDDGTGAETELVFERFASMDDAHLYCMRVTARPLNHDKSVAILSGLDTRVKTGGQIVTKRTGVRRGGDAFCYELSAGKKFGFRAACAASVSFHKDGKAEPADGFTDENGLLYLSRAFTGGKCYTAEKKVYVVTSRDGLGPDPARAADQGLAPHANQTYGALAERHKAAYAAYFADMDAHIEGDAEADAALRLASYHTAVSACREDSVHSVAAKGLTGERYNQFVWWDCEIYQLPFFIYTAPETAKNALLYRYRLLPQAKALARRQGYAGARYPFCSAVTGDERVWAYARHPFMQIHIDADIAYGVLHYAAVTGDEAFLRSAGLEMLVEIARFWVSRVTERNGRYEILGVTGTDEHHPYVDNDAYTNYMVRFVLERTAGLCGRLSGCEAAARAGVGGAEVDGFRRVARGLYLPQEENGLIPQFDGYFSLSRTLEEAGGNAAKSFQMKSSGLYHKSQVIKQPDVMLLYAYATLLSLPKEHYAENWDYYEKMCESSSSLSYPVHAICSADNGRMLSFYRYFMQTVRFDVDDIHHCAWQGVHSGCAAGGWYALFRGVFGFVCNESGIAAAPRLPAEWKGVSMRFLYRGRRIEAKLTPHQLTLTAEGAGETAVRFRGETRVLREKLELQL